MKSPALTVLGLCLSLLSGKPALADCALTKVSEMPLIKLGGHYAVMVRINDDIRPMIVDTGAATTTINLSAANDLALTRDKSLATAKPVLGFGQATAETYANAIPSVLAFGDLVYHDRSTIVAKQDFGDAPEEDAIGLLGDDILSQFDVEFDFPGRKLTFYRAFGCYDTFIPWRGAYSAIPFLHDNTKIVIDVTLNDERDQAIVDTGSSFSFVSRRLLKHWRVDESELSRTKKKMGSPLNGGTSFAVDLYTFSVVKIGYDVFPLKKMGIVDVDFPPASINLGLDFWSSHKLWISYPNKWMFVSGKSATAIAYPVQTPVKRVAGPLATGNLRP